MVIGLVQDQNGSNTDVEAADIVSLIVTADMTAASYGNINTNHFAIV